MLNRLLEKLKEILLGKPYTGKLKAGDIIYNPWMRKDVRVTKIVSDTKWYFEIIHPNYNQLRDGLEGEVQSRKVSLSELERRQNEKNN